MDSHTLIQALIYLGSAALIVPLRYVSVWDRFLAT